MFGNPETTTGGNALKFYASVRLDIRKATAIKDGEDVVGERLVDREWVGFNPFAILIPESLLGISRILISGLKLVAKAL